MSVPLQVSVEIGRTKKQVKDILTLSQGSLVVLDKLAGEQVDVFVNGQHVAKGDVVVVDDSFGVRVTEIIKNPEQLIKNEHGK
jgi:flagellar motor switch protein FliN/FliY